MNLKVKIFSDVNDWSTIRQEVVCDNKEVHFCVNDLSECPEDAIIGRNLFDAHDYLEALMIGIELGNQGYTDIEVEEITEIVEEY